ncbi:MAG: response regulator [Polyangiales bacterium]
MADLLVVDDDPDLAEALECVLLAYDHVVRVARNGEQALELIDERLPDLVLLDVEMPVLDGPSMAYRMLLTDMGREKIPIIFMSGVIDLHVVAAKVGTPYFLGKPYNLDALLTLLDRALVERRPPRPPFVDGAVPAQ